MFLRSYKKGGGADIALSAVVYAKHVDGGLEVFDTSGNRHMVSTVDWAVSVELALVSSLPAQPSTYLLTRVEARGKPDELMRSNVIGWGTYADGETRPIVIDKDETFSSTWFVEFPDGRVESNAGDQFASAEMWLIEAVG